MMNEDMQEQNEDILQKNCAEVSEDKAHAPRRFKKCLRRIGQGLCITLFGYFVVCFFAPYLIRRPNPYCGWAESDANMILADIDDYFAIPSHVALGPTPILIGPPACMKNGIQFSALSGKNTGEITGDIKKITVSILDGSGECPKSYQEATPGWTNGVFSKTIEPQKPDHCTP